MKKKKFLMRICLPAIFLFLSLEGVGYFIGWPRETDKRSLFLLDEKARMKPPATLEKENKAVSVRIQRLAPKGIYIVIDSARNILYLMRGKEVVQQAVISCGSGNILEEPEGERRWIFDTPKGEFYVKSKITNPDWVKPDWAFIEEGKEIPKNYSERVESSVLGDYALGFGDGYFIHGTLYTRLLGRSVTHGCIRVGDKDLDAVFRASQIGTKIYIY